MIRLNVFRALQSVCRAFKQRDELLTSEEDERARLAICENCRFFVHDIRQCDACTCFVDLKAKLTSEDCPKGFWPRTLSKGKNLASLKMVWQTITKIAREIRAKRWGR